MIDDVNAGWDAQDNGHGEVEPLNKVRESASLSPVVSSLVTTFLSPLACTPNTRFPAPFRERKRLRIPARETARRSASVTMNG